MTKRREPTRSGHWFITLDDGDHYVTDPVLVEVTYHGTQQGEGILAQFTADREGRHFTVRTPGDEIVMLCATVAGACGPFSARRGEYRVTWIAEVRPPRGLPKKDDPVPEAVRATNPPPRVVYKSTS